MTRKTNALRPMFEALEDRSVPAGVSLSNGVLYINGSINGPNAATVNGGTLNNPYIQVRFSYKVNNTSAWINLPVMTYSPGQVKLIRFMGGNLSDAFVNNTSVASKAWGFSGNDQLVGGSGRDEFYGGNNRDILRGNGGSDYLDGGADTDYLFGGRGNDWLIGGSGQDALYGQEDRDVLIGGNFNPATMRYYQDYVSDLLIGGSGADVAVAEWRYINSSQRSNIDEPIDFSAADGDRLDNP